MKSHDYRSKLVPSMSMILAGNYSEAAYAT